MSTPNTTKITRFEELPVYTLAEELADEIWVVVKRWDKFAQSSIGQQIVRSADNVGANLAKSTGRETVEAQRQIVRLARGELYETRHWLRRAYRRKLLTHEETHTLKTLLDSLVPELNTYIESIGQLDSSDVIDDK